MVFIILMLAMDLGVFHKKDHVIKIKEAAIWTGIWVTLAMLFGLLLRFKAEWVHGITCMDDLLQYIEGGTLASHISAGMDYAAALEVYRKEIFSQYLAGYFLEETLSIDNIFVMIMIFVSFGIDKQYYHRILFWGILGAIVMRFLFIFLLGAVIHKFSWVLAIFGVILIYSGIKEKILAAKRAGITDIVMCQDNKKDIDEIQDIYLKGVTFHYVENVQDVWKFALTDEIVDHPTVFEIDEEKKEKE